MFFLAIWWSLTCAVHFVTTIVSLCYHQVHIQMWHKLYLENVDITFLSQKKITTFNGSGDCADEKCLMAGLEVVPSVPCPVIMTIFRAKNRIKRWYDKYLLMVSRIVRQKIMEWFIDIMIMVLCYNVNINKINYHSFVS